MEPPPARWRRAALASFAARLATGVSAAESAAPPADVSSGRGDGSAISAPLLWAASTSASMDGKSGRSAISTPAQPRLPISRATAALRHIAWMRARDGDPAACHNSAKVAAVRGENNRTASMPPSVKLARVSVDRAVAILAS
jgi:hypothetical protein